VRVTVYIDGVFEHRYVQAGRAPRRENSTLHVMDDQQRIALVRVGEALETADRSPAVQYHLGDHLGSSAVVMDGAGKLINREEFLPFGETSFGSFKWKRYRFTGKERDEESGLYFHGARYYAPWLMRWTKPDSLEDSDEFNLYAYVRNNPINRIDPKGKESLIVTGTANNVKERQQFFNSAIREAYSLNKKGFENITIIAFKHGFSDKQLNTMKLISEKAGAKFIAIDSANMLLNYINFGGLTEANTSDFNNREVNKIENVAIFTHGLPGRLAFGYLTKKQIEYTFSFEHVDRLKKEAFASGDDYEFTSFSCRTGAKSDTDFGRNLAQNIASKIDRPVVSAIRRSDYSNIYSTRPIRWSNAFIDNISDVLREEFQHSDKDINDFMLCLIPKDRIINVEGADFWIYGAFNAPEAGETPEDLPAGWHIFLP
jgi:RHS repeat-associated protein